MLSDTWISRFPRRIPVTFRAGPTEYLRIDDLFAIRDHIPDLPGCECVAELKAEQIQIYRGTVPEELRENALLNMTAVYSLSSGGGTAVPTGRLFVRFDDQVDAHTQQFALRELGFEIERVPPYATNAAWIVSASSRPEDALHNIEKIRALPNVAHVEPQMLQPKVHKHGGSDDD